MGSIHSKHAKTPKDPYRARADQAASRINAQYLQGIGPEKLAAGVPNGKDPLFVMLRRNEAGKYVYDQEFNDRPPVAEGGALKGDGKPVVEGKGGKQEDRDKGGARGSVEVDRERRAFVRHKR